MPNVVSLNSPSIDITVGDSGSLGLKCDLLLENMAIRFESLPPDVEIVRSYIASQQVADYQSGCYGDVTWAVYSELYGQLSGVPAQERCQPFGLDLLGRLLFRPGADILDWREHQVPILYKPGQKVGVFVQVNGAANRFFSLFSALRVRSTTGFVELPGIVYHNLLNGSVTGVGAFSKRSLFSNIRVGGAEARITVQSLADGLDLQDQSIGVRSGGSGFNMTAAPVPVTYSSSTSLNPGPFKSVRSDWVALNTTAGDDLLVHSCVNGKWAYKNTAPEGDATCYVAGTSGHAAQNFSGTIQAAHCDVVAMIEVR